MKFEKLTENKIRVIISNENIPKENINNKKFVKFALENQDFFTKKQQFKQLVRTAVILA